MMGAMRKAILMMLMAVLSGSATAESAKDALFAKVVAGAECKQDVSNGLLCSYKVGKRLHIGIKDAGGNDPVISSNAGGKTVKKKITVKK